MPWGAERNCGGNCGGIEGESLAQRIACSGRSSDAEYRSLRSFSSSPIRVSPGAKHPGRGRFDRADAFYRQALARDPNFAEAAAGLAHSRLSTLVCLSVVATRLEEVKSIIDHALAVAPNSPEAHVARGVFFYWAHRQYDDALAEFNRALELQPNNALAQQFLGWVYRRRGEWERSIADAQRAQELDPRDPSIPSSLGGIYAALRLWNDAEHVELRTLTLDPYNAVAATLLAMVRLDWTGDINSARHAFDGFPPDILLNSLTFQGDVTAIVGMRAYVEVFARRFNDAFQAFEKQMGTAALRICSNCWARCPSRAGRRLEAAKSAGEEARPLLEARVKERPDDTFAMTQLAWVYLALGRNADALRVAQKAAELMPIEKDTLSGACFQTGLAQIEARAGAPEEAVKRLRHLLSIPAGQPISIARLKIIRLGSHSGSSRFPAAVVRNRADRT